MRKLKLLFVAAALLGGVCSGSAKKDVTNTYLTDANLASLVGWGNPGRTDWKTDGAVNVVEFWNWSNQFNFSQTAQLPAGYYRLAVNAFYRNSWGGDGTNNDMAWIFAGKLKQQNVIALNSMSDLSGYAGSNDLYRAATAFSQGKFSNEFDFKVTGEGTVAVEIGFKGTCPNGGWCILGPVTLYEYTVDDYIEDYRAKVTEAEALYDTPMYSSALDALKAAVVEESTLTTVDEVQDAVSTLSQAIIAANTSITAYANDIAPFNTLKAQAEAIAAVAYKETTDGSHDTFTAAISYQQTAVTKAEDAAAITFAVETLKAAVKTYVNNAEPANDGEYFDITCLMANPDFDKNNIDGWTKESALNPNTRIQCNEFFGSAAFDFYQVVEGLPNGSFTLSMKAFQRPGWYDGVYADYANGINNTTAKVYVNNDASVVKNIMEEMNDTRIYTDPNGEDQFNSDKKPANAPGFIPNSMEGAAAWFAAGKYQTEVAALVEDGTLRLGFKDNAHSSDVWTLFDEFRLHYYGSSKMIYYKQYLPQLKNEASADLSNALYNNVQGLERSEFTSALSATPASETEAAYKTVIDNITEKQAAFRTAVTAYDALVAAKAASLTKISSNIGTGVFQFNEATNNSLYSSYETVKGNVDSYSVDGESTAADIQAIVDAYNTAVNNYNNQALNAPATGKRYNVSIVEDGKDWDGNAITFIAGARSDMGLYGIKYLASANANLNQALKFTAVEGEANTYKVSAINAETGAEQYITTGTAYPEVEGNNNAQIRTTDDASKASWVKIAATTTDGQFQLLNVSDGNKVIANNNNNDMYTAGNANFTIVEAAQASVSIDITADVKLATRIFPFAPTLPEGVVAYSCEAKGEGDILTLEEVAEPAANTPYILYAPKGYSGDALTGWGTAGEVQYTAGWLTGVYADTAAPVGSYVLQKNNSDVAFYKVAEGKQPTVGANRGYLTASAAEGARALYFDFGGETTGISTMQNALSTMHNELFDLQGRKVAQPAKGLYIQNGKKVIMK